MASTRLTRPAQTWGLAMREAFVNPATPTAAELNNATYVTLFSCALTEDNTSISLGDSDTDDTLTFCSVGNESTPTFFNPTAQWTGLLDGNTGGSGSTVDLTSLYNKLLGWVGAPDIPYYIVSRTGPQSSQDIAFAVGHRIKLLAVKTDIPQWILGQTDNAQVQQNFLYDGAPSVSVNWNYVVAS
jgi:hypothetical protein